MSYNSVLTLGFCIALAAAIGTAFIKATSHQFSKDPAQSHYQGASVREEASRKAEDTSERQRRMMETMKSRIDRNKF